MLSAKAVSIPDRYGLVRRSTNVTFEAKDESGKTFTRGPVVF